MAASFGARLYALLWKEYYTLHKSGQKQIPQSDTAVPVAKAPVWHQADCIMRCEIRAMLLRKAHLLSVLHLIRSRKPDLHLQICFTKFFPN